jgi:hypothetical protein
LPVFAERDLYQHLGDRSDTPHADPRPVAHHYAGVLQLLQPVPAWRRRQADALGQRQLGDPAVILDLFEDAQIRCVELHAASCPSVGRDWMFKPKRRIFQL